MTIIIADGEKPKHPTPINILQNAEKIICCDGALSFLEQHYITPYIIIGDLDSITPFQKEKHKNRIVEDYNSEYSDLQKAIKYCLANKWEEITILGATGWREDHFLANIGILMHYANRASISMVTNFGVFTPIHQTTTFESYPGQQISVYSFSPESEISYYGLKYPVQNKKFKELWEGSLNESVSNSFTIEVKKIAAILVYAAFV